MDECWMLGTVVQDGDAPRVRLDCDAQTLSHTPRVPQGMRLSEGARVLLLKYGGAFLVVAVYQ